MVSSPARASHESSVRLVDAARFRRKTDCLRALRWATDFERERRYPSASRPIAACFRRAAARLTLRADLLILRADLLMLRADLLMLRADLRSWLEMVKGLPRCSSSGGVFVCPSISKVRELMPKDEDLSMDSALLPTSAASRWCFCAIARGLSWSSLLLVRVRRCCCLPLGVTGLVSSRAVEVEAMDRVVAWELVRVWWWARSGDLDGDGGVGEGGETVIDEERRCCRRDVVLVEVFDDGEWLVR